MTVLTCWHKLIRFTYFTIFKIKYLKKKTTINFLLNSKLKDSKCSSNQWDLNFPYLFPPTFCYIFSSSYISFVIQEKKKADRTRKIWMNISKPNLQRVGARNQVWNTQQRGDTCAWVHWCCPLKNDWGITYLCPEKANHTPIPHKQHLCKELP